MLTNETLKFLKELSKNNNKEWFEKNRKRYENAQTEIKAFIAEWIKNYGKKDESIAHLDPKKEISFDPDVYRAYLKYCQSSRLRLITLQATH